MYNYSLRFKRDKYWDMDYLQSEKYYTSDEFKKFVNEALDTFSQEDLKYLQLHQIFNKVIELHDDFSKLNIPCGIFIELEIERNEGEK